MTMDTTEKDAADKKAAEAKAQAETDAKNKATEKPTS